MVKIYLKVIGVLALIMVAVIVGKLLLAPLFTANKVVNASGAVISKTLDANNIIHNYEWFYDVNAGYASRYKQIQQFKLFYAEEKDSAEKSNLRMEMAAIQQTCRDLVTKYNANSQKMNRTIFKGWSLPETLVLDTCE